MKNAFTLVEVIVALVLLEVALVAVAGTLRAASETLRRAEVLESAVSGAEGVVDSLAGVAVLLPGRRNFGEAVVTWTVTEDGAVSLSAVTHGHDTLFSFPLRLVEP